MCEREHGCGLAEVLSKNGFDPRQPHEFLKPKRGTTFKLSGVCLSFNSLGSFNGSRVRGQPKYPKALEFVACIERTNHLRLIQAQVS